MALNALVTTVCVVTIAAIRWLAVLGVVRNYAIPAGGGFNSDPSSFHRQLGLVSGPSAALSHLDYLSWRVAFVAGIFWMLRLGLRSADHRIGSLRGVGLVTGFAVFVVTGVAHRVVECVVPRERTRKRLDKVITLWCITAVVTVVLVVATVNRATAAPATHTFGGNVVLVPLGWSIVRNGLQLAVALGGWAIAVFLTRSWIALAERADDTGGRGDRHAASSLAGSA